MIQKSTFAERLKKYRTELNDYTFADLEKLTGVPAQTLNRYELGQRVPKIDMADKIAEKLGINSLWLQGYSSTIEDFLPPERYNPSAYNFDIESLISFPIVGNIAAGYNGLAVEEYTDDTIDIPLSMLRGRKPQDYFVLRVTGHSMHPQFVDGDKVLVQRCSSVDSGSVAVILYNGEESTVKRVKYVAGENWLELIPTNPDYMTKRIEGSELEECQVLGKVVMLLRDVV